MTLQDVTSQLFMISVDAVFDGEKRSMNGLRELIKIRMLGRELECIQVNLRDGTWNCFITAEKTGKFGRGTFYDLIVPKDRAEEDHWRGKLLGA